MRWCKTVATDEQMQMVRLDSQVFNVPIMACGDFTQNLVK
jgi:hypothetical protein